MTRLPRALVKAAEPWRAGCREMDDRSRRLIDRTALIRQSRSGADPI